MNGMFSDMEITRSGQSRVNWDAEILVQHGTITNSEISAQLEGQRGAAGIKGTMTGHFFGPDAARSAA